MRETDTQFGPLNIIDIESLLNPTNEDNCTEGVGMKSPVDSVFDHIQPEAESDDDFEDSSATLSTSKKLDALAKSRIMLEETGGLTTYVNVVIGTAKRAFISGEVQLIDQMHITDFFKVSRHLTTLSST